MIKNKLFSIVLFCVLLFTIGCNNETSENKSTIQDTATNKDTTHTESPGLSEPH